MKIEINSKFSIGSIVQKYQRVGEYKDKVICPLCGGKHFVDNPNFVPDEDGEDYDNKLKCPHCDEDGYIRTNYVEETVLDPEVYRVTDIAVYIKKDKVEYMYGIQSTPELNSRAFGYKSCAAYENELEAVKERRA